MLRSHAPPPPPSLQLTVSTLTHGPHHLFTAGLHSVRSSCPTIMAVINSAFMCVCLCLCRTLTVPIADVVKPGYTSVVVGEGMPKSSGGRGNLILELDLLFPPSVSETQKMLIRSAFFLPLTLNDKQAKAVRAYEAAFRDTLQGWASGIPVAPTTQGAAP